MKQHNKSFVVRLAAIIALFLAICILPVLATADDTTADQSTANASGHLEAPGGWVAFSLPYNGSGSKILVTLNYNPADQGTDTSVFMELYSPNALPPNGKPLGVTPMVAQNGESGTKQLSLGYSVAGNYILILHNGDVTNRPIDYSISTFDPINNVPGPALTYVSSGPTPQPVSGAGSAPKAMAAVPTERPANVQSGQSISAQLAAPSGWIAYSLPYDGNGSEIQLNLTYTPADVGTDSTVIMDLYSPNALPPNNKPIGTTGSTATTGSYSLLNNVSGSKRLSLGYSVAGNYVVVLHNGDTSGRTIDYTISTFDPVNYLPGPVLTYLSSGN